MDNYLEPKINVEHSNLTNYNQNTMSSVSLNNFTAEPITLAALCLVVLNGALEKLGAKIFSSIFDTDLNVKELLKETVRQVEIVIKEAFDADALRRCEARIDALTSLMKQYRNAPDSSLDRLIEATTEANSLRSECKSLGFKALLPFCTAVGLQIVVLQERLVRLKDPGERTNIINLCNESYYYAALDAMLEIKQWSDARFSNVEFQQVSPSNIGYYYKFNGKFVQLGPGNSIHNSEDFIIREREEHMKSELERTRNDLKTKATMELAYEIWKVGKMYTDEQ